MGLDPLPLPWPSSPPSLLFVLQVLAMNSNHGVPPQILYKPSTSSQSGLAPSWAQPMPLWCLNKSLLLYQLGLVCFFLSKPNTILLKLFQKTTDKGTSQAHSIRPLTLWYQNQTKTPQKRENYRPILSMNIYTKNFQILKLLAKQIQQYIKRITHHGFLLCCSGFQCLAQ